MKKVLFLGGPIFQIPVIKKAKELGLEVGVIDRDPHAPAIPYADIAFFESLRDFDAVLRVAAQYSPDGIVIGACDTSVRAGAYVCSRLGLPGHTEETALTATDKYRMLLAFESSGVAHPAFQLIHKNELDSFSLSIPLPVVSKPIDNSGGRGINLITHPSELHKAVESSSHAGISGDVLIEEYMQGPEVSVEILVVDGVPHVLQITDKITSGAPHFYEIGHSQPSSLPSTIKEQVRTLACRSAIAIGLINSPAHAEIKITENGPKMVEIGARLGGGCITTYLLDTSVAGINMAESAIHLALGEKPDLTGYHDSGIASAVRFISAENGRLLSVNGTELAAQLPNVIDVETMASPGDYFRTTVDNAGRVGFVVAKGPSPTIALDTCSKAIGMIHFNYRRE